MSVRNTLAAALAAAVLLAGCKEQTPIPHTPAIIKIVSGGGQSGDLSSALDSALVVQVARRRGQTRRRSGTHLDAVGRWLPVRDVDDQRQRRQVDCQMDPRTDARQSGRHCHEHADRWRVGVVRRQQRRDDHRHRGRRRRHALRHVLAFPGARGDALALERRKRRFSPDRIVVGFKNDALGVASAASNAYRSMAVARAGVRAHSERRRVAVEPIRAQPRRDFPGARRRAPQGRRHDEHRSDDGGAARRSERRVGRARRDHLDPRRRAASDAVRPLCAIRRTSAVASAAAAQTRLPERQIYWAAILAGEHDRSAARLGDHDRKPERHRCVGRHGHSLRSPEHLGEPHGRRLRFRLPDRLGTPRTFATGGRSRTIDGRWRRPRSRPYGSGRSRVQRLDCWEHSSTRRSRTVDRKYHRRRRQRAARFGWRELVGQDPPDPSLGYHGDGSLFDVAQGVLYAAGFPRWAKAVATVQAPSRAQIINMSLGGIGASTTLQNAVTAATNAGSLVVASAGNDGIDDFPSYRRVSERHGALPPSAWMECSRRTPTRGRTSPSRRRAAISASTTTAAEAFSVLAGTSTRASRPTFFGYGTSALGAVRLGHRCAPARADAVAHGCGASLAHRAICYAARGRDA